MSSSFYKLDPKIQEAVWDLGWEELRPLQVESIDAILGDGSHLILSAATASGKTEAAFLPILSRIAGGPRESIQALYISPLIALINDQFRRLEQLCEKAGIAVHRRHGGVAQSERHRMMKRPSGRITHHTRIFGGIIYPARLRVGPDIFRARICGHRRVAFLSGPGARNTLGESSQTPAGRERHHP